MYMNDTSINVTGIVPSLKLEKEVRRMKANTTPLAPSSCTCGNRIKFTMPVTSAVARITNKMLDEPYFSSSIGPITSSSVILPIKCSQFACPNTCPINRKYVNGSANDERYTLNKSLVEAPPVILPRSRAARQINENVSTTGELKTIRKLFAGLPTALPPIYLLVTHDRFPDHVNRNHHECQQDADSP